MAKSKRPPAKPSSDPIVAAFEAVNRLTGTTPPKTKATPAKRRPRQQRKSR